MKKNEFLSNKWIHLTTEVQRELLAMGTYNWTAGP